MAKKWDVVALGELLVDFTENGQSAQGNPLFEANPGGAPCNVLAMLQKLGRRCAFIGKVGDDMFGRWLRGAAEEAGIGTESLIPDGTAHTTLAFVKTAADGDRDFSFYRDPGADMLLRADELPEEICRNTRIFHFGTLSMTHPGVREATKRAVKLARDGGALISFDPNLRPPLWRSEADAREQIAWGIGRCDILKIADNELEFMTGETDPDRGAAALRARYPDIRLLCVTSGAEGSRCWSGDQSAFVPAFRLGGTVDATGAGDTFCACVLHAVLERGPDEFKTEDLRQMLRFANAAAYIVTTKKGALRAMPERAEVEALLRAHPAAGDERGENGT